MIGFRWLTALLTMAPLHLGVEVERSTKRRRAAARLNNAVMNRAQCVAAVINERSDDPSASTVEGLRSLMSEVARRADR